MLSLQMINKLIHATYTSMRLVNFIKVNSRNWLNSWLYPIVVYTQVSV